MSEGTKQVKDLQRRLRRGVAWMGRSESEDRIKLGDGSLRDGDGGTQAGVQSTYRMHASVVVSSLGQAGQLIASVG